MIRTRITLRKRQIAICMNGLKFRKLLIIGDGGDEFRKISER